MAQGDETIEVDFKVSFSNKSYSYGDPERKAVRNFTAIISWDELLAAIGPSLMHLTRDSRIRADIARFIREKYHAQLLEGVDEDVAITSSSIGETIFQTIKLQFRALGLINSISESKIVRETEKEIQLSELTKLGKQQLLKLRAIYREKVPNEQVEPTSGSATAGLSAIQSEHCVPDNFEK